MILEACVGNFLEAQRAQNLGAHRIELCDNLSEGGTTPSFGTIKAVIGLLSIPAVIMIRPRSGKCCYSKAEYNIMVEDIKICKSLGVKSVAFGILNPDKSIDYPKTQELLNLSYPMQVTFHKAIDELKNPELEVEKLANIGVKKILTSGGATTAILGKDTLLKMLVIATQHSIEIVVAGKVHNGNLLELKAQIPAREFHGKLIVGNLN